MTLIIIYGQVRTMETAIISIYKNIILENFPCHVILSIDGKLSDIPEKTLELLDSYILDIYFTNLKHEDDIPRDHHRIEFTLVQNALERLSVNQIEVYDFLLKVRTDLYVKYPLCLRKIYGMQSFEDFKREWNLFIQHEHIVELNTPIQQIKAWILTGSGIPTFLNMYKEDHVHPSPWSLLNTIEWNKNLWSNLENKMTDNISLFRIHQIIRQLLSEYRVSYLIGSTWIHFGFFRELCLISKNLKDKYGTYRWFSDDNTTMKWVDHKNTGRSKSQAEWKWITDDQIRLCSRESSALIDLVNSADYIESFDAKHTLIENIKNPNLFSFIIRPQSIRQKRN